MARATGRVGGRDGAVESAATRKSTARSAAPARRRPPRVERLFSERAQPETLRLRTVSVSLTVDDVARSLAFYTDVLGFVAAERWEEDGRLVGVTVKAGRCEIGISQDDWTKGRNRKKGEGIRLWFETAQDVDALARRIRGAGHALAQEPQDHEWGVRSIYVDDPDGYHLTIFRPIAK
jgi:catechol 2,3-dioxygenase-like lactoylglutathione lyase family enzyme